MATLEAFNSQQHRTQSSGARVAGPIVEEVDEKEEDTARLDAEYHRSFDAFR
jgi:hypothetical protein